MTPGRIFVPRQRLGREHVLYALGALGVGVHTIDHLVSDPDWTPQFDFALLLAALTMGLAMVYPWVTPWVRELGGLGMGLTWAVAAFVHHFLGLFVGGPAPTDYTGVFAAVGGVLMVMAAIRARAHRTVVSTKRLSC